MQTGAFAAIFNDKRHVLLCHRRDIDAWNLPGGRVEWAEILSEALRREVVEETGLEVAPGDLAGLVERIHPDEGFHYVILDYHVTVTGGTLRPGSDVTDARWVLPSEMVRLELSDGLLEALRDFGLTL